MGLLDTLKDVVVLVQKADNIELVKQVLGLQMQAQEMLEENRLLKGKVVELEKSLQLAKALSFRAPFYYVPSDETPFCPRCWEGNRKTIHVVLIFRQKDTRWDCPECKRMYLIRGPHSGSPEWTVRPED